MEIIDVHAHVYPDAIAIKAAESIGDFYHLPIAHNGTVEALLSENKKAGISSSVIHSVAVSWERASKINHFIAQTLKDYPGAFVGFAAVHPDDPHLIDTLEEAKRLGLKGIKLHPDFQHFDIDDVKAYPIYQWAQDQGFVLMVHTGDIRYTTSRPQRMAKVLRDFPNLQTICAHLGGWSQWEEGYKALSGLENAWIDTSSSLYALAPEKAKKIIEKYDLQRVLFGTDYPMWNPSEEVERFLALGFSARVMEDILANNAKELLAF